MRKILMVVVGAVAAGVAGAENRIFMKQSEEPFTPPYNVANQEYWTGGKMPEVGSGDYGLIQSRLCTLENPAIIDSDLTLDQLDVGFSNNTNTSAHVPVLEIRGGTVSLPHNLFVGYEQNSIGLVRLTGGVLSDSILAVARAGKGVVTNAGGRIVGKVGSVDSLKIATNDLGDGEYVQTAGELVGRGCYIGRNGKGRFDFLGGTVSFGTLINVGGTADATHNGTGVFNIAADNGGALLASTLNVGLP